MGTAFLVQQELVQPIKDMDDCIRQQCTLCVDSWLQSFMKASYADAVIKYVDVPPGNYTSNTDEVVKRYEMAKSGQCDAVLVYEEDYRHEERRQDCGMVFTGRTVLSFYLSQPAAEFYAG